MEFIKRQKISADIFTFREYITYNVVELTEATKNVLSSLALRDKVNDFAFGKFLAVMEVCIGLASTYGRKEVKERAEEVRKWINTVRKERKTNYLDVVKKYNEVLYLLKESGLLQMEKIKEEVKK